MSRARILLADDHGLFREGLASLIRAQSDLAVAGQAEDGLEALTLARNLHPDLILMDIHMPLCDGLEATRRIREVLPETPILILTISQDDEMLFEAIRAGANGYALKDSSSDAFLGAVRKALAGEAVLPDKLIPQLLREFASLADQPALTLSDGVDSVLSTRETDVLDLIATGATNQEIAERLSISLYTVKSHVRNILRKLEVNSRHEAANLAIQKGWVRPRRPN